METEASRCSFCDAPFRSHWPLPFEVRDHDSGIVTYICPKCASQEQIEADFAKSLFSPDSQDDQLFGRSAAHAWHQESEHGHRHLAQAAHPDFLDDAVRMLDILRWHRFEHGQVDRPLHVLHIGCGQGTLLNHLRSHASMALVLVGIEPCAHCATKAQGCGLTISSTPLENEVRPAKIAFDLIIDQGSSDPAACSRDHRQAVRHHLFEDGVFMVQQSEASWSRAEVYWDCLPSHASNLAAEQRLATLSSHCVLFRLHELCDTAHSQQNQRAAMHSEATARSFKRRTKSSWRIRLTGWASALQAALGE